MRVQVEIVNPKHFPKECSTCSRPIHPEVTFPGGWSVHMTRVVSESEASVVFRGMFFFVDKITCPRCTVPLQGVGHVQ